MKTLRYLLILMGLVSVLSLSAQSTAQLPQAQMQSTSIMQSGGSTLPQAAVNGVVTTYETQPKAYVGPRRSPGDHHDEVHDDPIGDAAIPLLMLAAAYALLRVYKRKRSV